MRLTNETPAVRVANDAIDALTNVFQKGPRSRDLLTLWAIGLYDDQSFEEEEKIGIVRQILGEYDVDGDLIEWICRESA